MNSVYFLAALFALIATALSSPVPCANPVACPGGMAARAVQFFRRQSEGDGGSSSPSTTVIIGAACGGVVALILLGTLIHCCCRDKSGRGKRNAESYAYN
ncbi:hypothetical protein GGF49_001074 [Coemansia sp. RSA 1853]|nr:hypothetical protein GGF49_001074 [Coemansia sp. RSA 1853]